MVEGKIREWKGHSSGGAEVTEGGADQAKSRYEESTQATQGLASRRRLVSRYVVAASHQTSPEVG